MKKNVFVLFFAAIVIVVNAQTWYDPQPGDGTWIISQRCYGTGVLYDTIAKANHLNICRGPNPNWIYHDVQIGVPLFIPNLSPKPKLQPEFKPAQTIAVAVPASLPWWTEITILEVILFLILIFILIGLIKFIKRANNLETEVENLRHWQSKALILEKENENLKNKLPIEAPKMATSEWLENNNPAGKPIPLPNTEDNGESTIQATERAFGGKPDFIAYAKVSTIENGIQMQFSNNRQAVTGLNGINVFMGWNWNKEKSRWEEVGMLAGPCSNGFEANPGAVKKGEIFSKIELVNGQSPIIFVSENVPVDVLYPKLILPLVLQHHEKNITDIRRTGSKVEIPEDLVPKTKKLV